MAVQAQYPFNLLFNRNEQELERKEMDCSQQLNPPPIHSPLFFTNDAINGTSTRKRGRDGTTAGGGGFQMVPQNQMNGLISHSIQSQAFANLAQQHHHHHHQQQQHPPPLVSTGLRLSFDEENNHLQDLVSLNNQQRQEIDHYLTAQGEQLRRTLADKRQRHYRALLAVAEESANRRLKEKEAEVDRAARRTAELEEKINRLRTESMTWQAKAMTSQATAASLHVQIQHATSAAANRNSDGEFGRGESAAEDAESAHVDPNRVQANRRLTCRVCHLSAVSVVVLPCRHLCLCSGCDAAVSDSDGVCCPVCHAGRTGSVQVFLS